MGKNTHIWVHIQMESKISSFYKDDLVKILEHGKYKKTSNM